jgi:serine/threonine protein kinase/tetratricopeptide (TPR) repeat protein
MTNPGPNDDAPASFRHERWIDEACDRFEAAWKTGDEPRIDDYLAQFATAEPSRIRALLHELVLIDIEYRWSDADRQSANASASSKDAVRDESPRPPALPAHPLLEDYAAHYPQLGPLNDLPLTLTQQEYRIRGLHGARPSPSEYAQRFPGRADVVRALQELDVAKTSLLGADLGCPDNETLRRFLTGQMPQIEAEAIKLHIERCSTCVDRLGQLADSEGRQSALDQSIAEGPGTVIGLYKLLEQIGEGGFGMVFLADQDRPLKRKVALKIIKPGMDTRQVITRFAAERQALAMMDHPNIAKVHDAGATENGRPYFVMELVQGVPITEYCDKCHLSIRERLQLFVTVCEAMQHAHQKGVIHRDIKPTNVLVAIQDGQPTPKVIDFGVAKAINQQLTEQTLATGFSQMIGTPLYMSPEQAELSPLGVDTRSDIYSLGVLLYELLTGATPFEKDRLHAASYDELRRIIREEEPPRPSARLSTLAADVATTVAERRRTDVRRLRDIVRGELDWIVMKCLEKDRNRRYDSSSNLALDVTRYLLDEPVQAFPPTPAYRLRKFARRYRTALSMAIAVISLLILGIVASTWHMVRATRAEQRAETTRRLAHQAINDSFTKVSEALVHEPNLQPLRRELLADALKYFEQFALEHHDRPELKTEQAATCFRLAILRIELGTGENWLPWLDKGVGIVEQLLEEDHDASVFETLQTGQRWFGGATNATAIPDFGEAAQILQRARRAWEELVRRYPNTPGFQNDLAACYVATGSVVAITDPEQAAELNSKAIEIWQGLADAHPNAPHYRAALVNTLAAQGPTLMILRKLPEAEEVLRRAVPTALSLVNEFRDAPGYRDLLGKAYGHLGHHLARTNRLNDADHFYREAMLEQETLHKRYPTVARYRLAHLMARQDLAEVLWATDQKPEAREQFQQVLALCEQIDPGDSLAIRFHAWFLNNCADPQFRNVGRAAELTQSMMTKAPLQAFSWQHQGTTYYRKHEYRAAIGAFTIAMQLHDRSVNRLFLAMAHAQLGETKEAREHFEKADALAEKELEGFWFVRIRSEAERLLGLQQPSDQPDAAAESPTAPANETQENIRN